MKTTRRREIIREPGTGRKVAKGVGIALMCLTIFFGFVFLIAALDANLPLGPFFGILVVVLILIVISALLIRAGRTRREVISETIDTDEAEDEEKK